MENNKSTGVFVREASEGRVKEERSPEERRQKLKKLIIYALMAVVCVGCLYLIFRPNKDAKELSDAGLNNSVPQADDQVLTGDKEKAYEQELLEKKESERRKAMLSLSDYLNNGTDTSNGYIEGDAEMENANPTSQGVKNYREIQQTLGSFYQSDPENEKLRRELRELKERNRANDASSQNTLVQDPVLMMEKSYQMAAKYLPQLMPQKTNTDTVKKATPPTERYVEPVYTAKKNVVSSLYRANEQSDQDFAASVLQGAEKRFFDGHSSESSFQSQILRNSIRACVHQTKTVTMGSSVSLRLLEGARIARMTLPAGTLLTAMAKLQDGRLGLQITSVEFKGNIVPVDLSAYDLDGQAGLNLLYSPDVNAMKEIASGMSTSAGTNIVLSSSTGQQLISDLTKGIVQGTTGYISKRIGTSQVTVKAGYLLFLVPKK
ncbi:Bacteroides conjugative transposon TraM protein [Chryseobacterium wanjuense]|uniref:Bacteroides conjugative transposon TraM protein n=1 Tax=Chryseobacterium wanjuense TaxID=356305 RepID=A0A1I0QF20_9FLAO|nr:conjugative transposon protein TraM [Chryseobacterium wanjuense]SEW25432.1 Bacteroides conjugative transposon TraM protein [Chryseobacterium wanjuense]